MKGRHVGIVVVLVAIVAALLWFALRGDDPPTAPPTPEPVASESASPRAETGRARAALDEPVAPPAPAAPQAPAGPVCRGQVLDTSGRPVAGARVVSNPDDLGRAVALREAGGDGSRTFVATSDADGRFVVRIDPASIQSVCTAESDVAGFGQAPARRGDDVVVRLQPWSAVSGHVRDVEKKPIAGAVVRIGVLVEALTVELTATTDADGAYRAERVPPQAGATSRVWTGRHLWAIASADGYAPVLLENNGMGGAVRPEVSLDFTLVRGATLEGRVVDAESGEGIEGARVVCWSIEAMMSFGGPSGSSISNPWGPRPLQETTSGPGGAFRFEHLPASGPSGVASHNMGKRGMTMGHVAAWKDGWCRAADEVPVVKDGVRIETELRLWPSATLTGRVVDAAGAPVAGASVWGSVEGRAAGTTWLPPFYGESASAWPVTDAEGRYRYDLVQASRAGPTTVRVMASKAISPGARVLSETKVDVAAGATAAAPDIVLDAAAVPTAVLTVVDAAGAPVVGAALEQEGLQSQRTGLDGRVTFALDPARLRGVAEVPPQRLVLRARGFAPQIVDVTPATGTPAEVRVEMRPGTRVSGRVVRRDGTPYAKASVSAGDGTLAVADVFPPGAGPARPPRDAQGRRLLTVFCGTLAADDGTFTIEDLPDGPFHVRAMAYAKSLQPGRPPKQLADVRSGVPAGATDVLLTIPDDDAPPTQPLVVTVTAPDGKALEGASVQAVTETSGTPVWAQPAADGTFRFAGLPAGRWTVTARATGFAPTPAPLIDVAADVAPSPIVIVLDRGLSLRGTVRVAGGPPPADLQVYLLRTETEAMPMWTPVPVAKDGSYAVSGLVAGAWRPVALGGDLGPTERPTFVADGNGVVTLGDADASADLVLVAGGVLRVACRDARLPPPPFGGEAVDAEKERFGGQSAIEILAPTGAVVHRQTGVFANMSAAFYLAPGDYVVRLRLPGQPPRDERCTVAAGGRASVNFAAQ